jgi:rubrerythrin
VTAKPTDIGPNRTGISVSPRQSKEAVESAQQGVARESLDVGAHHRSAVAVARDSEPLGTMPPPASVKGAAKAMLERMKGNQPTVFLDAIGERIAFERTGVRLYEALLCRFDAAHPHAGSPSRGELERIRDEELGHFQMLCRAMEQLGGDPTTVTPSADAIAVASSGLVGLVNDPRATLTEGLKAILVAELADNDSWAMLCRMADDLGQDDLAEQFRNALTAEEEHLASVRSWLQATVEGQLGISPSAEARPEAPQPGA